jgi:hypothetical protein
MKLMAKSLGDPGLGNKGFRGGGLYFLSYSTPCLRLLRIIKATGPARSVKLERPRCLSKDYRCVRMSVL